MFVVCVYACVRDVFINFSIVVVHCVRIVAAVTVDIQLRF